MRELKPRHILVNIVIWAFILSVVYLMATEPNKAKPQTIIDPKNRIIYTPLTDSTRIQYEYFFVNPDQIHILPDSTGFAPVGLDAYEHYTNSLGRNGYRLHTWDTNFDIIIYERQSPPLKTP